MVPSCLPTADSLSGMYHHSMYSRTIKQQCIFCLLFLLPCLCKTQWMCFCRFSLFLASGYYILGSRKDSFTVLAWACVLLVPSVISNPCLPHRGFNCLVFKDFSSFSCMHCTSTASSSHLQLRPKSALLQQLIVYTLPKSSRSFKIAGVLLFWLIQSTGWFVPLHRAVPGGQICSLSDEVCIPLLQPSSGGHDQASTSNFAQLT